MLHCRLGWMAISAQVDSPVSPASLTWLQVDVLREDVEKT